MNYVVGATVRKTPELSVHAAWYVVLGVAGKHVPRTKQAFLQTKKHKYEGSWIVGTAATIYNT